jgi:hypothetical protein
MKLEVVESKVQMVAEDKTLSRKIQIVDRYLSLWFEGFNLYAQLEQARQLNFQRRNASMESGIFATEP